MAVKYGVLAFAAAGALALGATSALAQNGAQSAPAQPPTTEDPMATESQSQEFEQQAAFEGEALLEEDSGSSGSQQLSEAPPPVSEDLVRDLQQALSDQGHDVQVDGIWGPQTAQALSEYQESQGQSGNGQLDAETLASLDLGSEQQTASAQDAQAMEETTEQATLEEGPSGDTATFEESTEQATAPGEFD